MNRISGILRFYLTELRESMLGWEYMRVRNFPIGSPSLSKTSIHVKPSLVVKQIQLFSASWGPSTLASLREKYYWRGPQFFFVERAHALSLCRNSSLPSWPIIEFAVLASGLSSALLFEKHCFDPFLPAFLQRAWLLYFIDRHFLEEKNPVFDYWVRSKASKSFQESRWGQVPHGHMSDGYLFCGQVSSIQVIYREGELKTNIERIEMLPYRLTVSTNYFKRMVLPLWNRIPPKK